MIYVTKFDGRKEPFLKEKIIRTCLRIRASYEQAKAVADEIEKKAYDGIPTKKILELIFKYLKNFKPEVKYQIDLREAIALLKPKPDFERFVQLILSEYGYEVKSNLVVAGSCVEHEIDGILRKEDEIIMLEVKHHLNHHVYTGLDVVLEVNSSLEDLKEGFKLRRNSINFSKALIVCNTKFSDHAIRYAKCKGIELIGWKYPEEKGLESLIEEKKLYPITFLRDLNEKTREKFSFAGIFLLKQLLDLSLEEIHEKTGISRSKLRKLVENAMEIIYSK